ncbi:MAG: trehalose-phosphatase [Acidisphaera sp.]|nr:trehalose-phosphatase [Acidisphaera sp.]MBV9813327.1 trehalose-phosphatase [Acetobacteraceae bacterium]
MPDRAALLLDFDGTLVDLAPTPDAVTVPPGLPDTLLALRGLLDDAVAIVTGRPIAQVDALLPGIPYAVAGEHGAAVRHKPGAAVGRSALPAIPADWIERAEALVAEHPGALVERKDASFVLHYRLAPDAGAALGTAATAIVVDDAGFTVMPAHMAWEVKPRGVDKARAVSAVMEQPPFAGRVPVYLGDDVTDEDGMREARARGGIGLRVPEVFGAPAGVRAWLAAEAARLARITRR